MTFAVGCCFQRTNYPNHKTDIFFMPIEGALENSTLREHYNLTYFSQKLFFNVKIIKKLIKVTLS